MSCIYGPHQHGNEDQGWVAHFLLRALRGEPITIFGDGAQVRDVLHASDLVEAMLLARDEAGRLAGRALNVGGGPENAVNLLEVVDMIEAATGERPALRFAEERPGDQRWYLSDVSTIGDELGWSPAVAAPDGIAALHEWLSGTGRVEATA
jgi:CDP-paratose 2-epimerase